MDLCKEGLWRMRLLQAMEWNLEEGYLSALDDHSGRYIIQSIHLNCQSMLLIVQNQLCQRDNGTV